MRDTPTLLLIVEDDVWTRSVLETAREQLSEIHDAVKARAGRNEAAIFRAHQAFLTDIDLFSEVYEIPLRQFPVASGFRGKATHPCRYRYEPVSSSLDHPGAAN